MRRQWISKTMGLFVGGLCLLGMWEKPTGAQPVAVDMNITKASPTTTNAATKEEAVPANTEIKPPAAMPEPILPKEEPRNVFPALSDGKMATYSMGFRKKETKPDPVVAFAHYHEGIGISLFSSLISSEGGSYLIPVLPRLFLLSRLNHLVELEIGLGMVQTGVVGSQNLQFSNFSFGPTVRFHPLSSPHTKDPLVNFNVFAGLRMDMISGQSIQTSSTNFYMGAEFGMGVQLRVARHVLFRFLELGGVVQAYVGGGVIRVGDATYFSEPMHTAFFARSSLVALF